MTRAPQNWRIQETDESAVDRLGKELLLPSPIARVLVHRGKKDPDDARRFLRKSLQDLATPFGLSGMDAAADRVCAALERGEKVFVHGDCDADGITSTALLKSFLGALGGRVTCFVPNRLEEGHGIAARAVRLAREEKADLFVTCDCGMSSQRETEELAALGLSVLITDHHEVQDRLPAPAILVNPHLPGCDPAHRDLSGVGVAFLLAVAVRSRLRERGFFASREEPDLKELLDFVSVGTLADMAALTDQNRILVAAGLRQIAVSRRPGISALRVRAGLEEAQAVSSEDVGFRLAPRINASARLGHEEAALRLLLTDDEAEAGHLADQLEDWNRQRREMEERMTRIAGVTAERQAATGRMALVVASPEFHPGIVGLVAHRLSATWGRPAFVFSLRNGTARGSARTAGGVNVVEALESCRDLFTTFGGHKEAAGCQLLEDRLSRFESEIEKAVSRQGVAALHEVLIDARLDLGHLNSGFLALLDQLKPYGAGNPEPLFLAQARVVGSAREVGKGHVRAKLRNSGGEAVFSAVGFDLWDRCGELLRGTVEVVFTPEENLWNGKREIQLRLRHVRIV
jgi:single-stranded-DNA-specific exonuclease